VCLASLPPAMCAMAAPSRSPLPWAKEQRHRSPFGIF
jgi:hypothetical protein